MVAWDKLTELCDQLMERASHVYAECRLQTHKYEKGGQPARDMTDLMREITEVAADEAILPDKRKDDYGVEKVSDS